MAVATVQPKNSLLIQSGDMDALAHLDDLGNTTRLEIRWGGSPRVVLSPDDIDNLIAIMKEVPRA